MFQSSQENSIHLPGSKWLDGVPGNHRETIENRVCCRTGHDLGRLQYRVDMEMK